MKIVDIAKMAGTSVATVSRVINNDPHVSDETRKQVQKVLIETEFVPNSAGKSLRQSKSRRVLAILPTITNPVYAPLIQGLSDRANANGYSIMLAVTDRNPSKEKECLDILKMRSVDGAILFATTLNDEYIESIAKKWPIVSCLSPIKGGKVSYCCIDDISATMDATNHLIDLGHKRIAVIRNTFKPSSQDGRDAGYRMAMNAAGLQVNEHEMFYCEESKQVYEAMATLLDKKDIPTAVFSFSDMLAIPAIKCLSDRGFVVGKDIDVMGFDNIDFAQYSTPSLSSVSQPLYQLGTSSFELLYEKIEDINSIVKGVIFPHRLVLRDSTRKKYSASK